MSRTTKLVRPALPVAGRAASAWHLAKLEEALPAGGSAYANICNLDDDLSLTGDRVRSWAFTVPGYYKIPSGTTVRIEWGESEEEDGTTSGRWIVTGVYD